ncbi:MAG: hypothetical protein HY927_15685 [Elusimicrobia bacterium]|nr:hypothetical protein [Elusimicrobiota bacterium]
MRSILVLSLLAAQAASASARPLAPPAPAPVALDAQALNRLFDGNASPASDPVAAPSPEESAQPSQASPSYIIRAEQDPLPAAPRFALNLSAVPEHLRSMVDGFHTLFHKNQEETQEWVDRMNVLIRAKNAGRRWGKIPEWTYDGRPNEPPWTCLSDGAGTVNDWWALQLGRSLPSYQSAVHGGREEGVDPRMLELAYLERARTGDPEYFLLPKFIEEDPVRHLAIPQQPRGYAELLIEDGGYDARDPVTDQVHRWTPGMSAMEGRYKELFVGSLLSPRTPDKYARVLAEGIEKWGIAYVQLEDVKRPRLTGAHTVAVVGYFCMEGTDRLIPCSENKSDEDWGRTAYFAVHDSFGDFPADKVRDASGGSAYRAVRISSIDQAIVFPHSLAVTARPESPGTWRVTVTNKGGRPVQVGAVRASAGGTELPVAQAPDGSLLVSSAAPLEASLYVEARHYFEADGKGRAFRLALAAGPTAGVEAVRTPRTPTYAERRARLPSGD